VIPGDLQPLLPVLEAVTRLIDAVGGRGMVIGGVAVSLIGTPRFTADVDAVVRIPDERIEALVGEAARLGLEPRVKDAVAFGRSRRVLLFRHRESGIGLDLALAMLPFEDEAIGRAREISVGPHRMRIPAAEDLIVFKAVAHRPKDLEDIRGVVAQHPDLDRQRIGKWIQEFARALDMPELWNDVRPLLRRRR